MQGLSWLIFSRGWNPGDTLDRSKKSDASVLGRSDSASLILYTFYRLALLLILLIK